ncbi:MAG: hypothetical protein ABS52_05920 [Gemmatimonadetes bacterium SCN 70-22]|nr:MAG: hypothetical protein ABS52_05920 [Gemmatimonadetes bacterium SCN 70-22]
MSKIFRVWRERLAAAFGIIPDRLRYTRKSTESEDRQVASHDQQAHAADEVWGPISREWWWKDSCSGTSFDRPEFQDLLEFCRQNPRPKSNPGRVELYDPSRFGRTLDEDGQPDIMAFQSVFSEFERYNWRICFVTVQRTNDQLVDMITMALYAYAAALYSANLSKSVRRGRIGHASKGWWVGGSAPWGTKRWDTLSDRELADGQRSTPGGGGTILIPDHEVLKHWEPMARKYLAGVSLDRIGAELYKQGVRGARGGKLGHRSVRNYLSNPVLVGEIAFLGEEKEGKRMRRRERAEWGPMVDVELFREVEKEIGGHSKADGERQRRHEELFPLKPACAHCGVEYNGGRLAKKQGGTRGYVHAKPKERMNPERFERFSAAGCKAWYVDAEELETKIKDLIVAQRSSNADYEATARDLILERDEFRKSAEDAVARAEQELAQREAAYKRLAHMAAAVASDDDDGDDALVERLKAAKQQVGASKAQLAEAQRFAQSRQSAWDRLSSIIHESRNLADAWETAGPEERTILLDYWVADVLIVVEPVPGMKRANHKTAVVTLRTAPNAPAYFELGGSQPPSRETAAFSSSSTQASDSAEARARSGSSASAEPIAPNAHAACPRTSGSSSESAAASAATSSGDPALPSTTAELRFNPRSLARFMGEPLKAAENSGCDMASSSRASDLASLPDSAGRAANAGSDSSFANLWLYGHTSWQMSHPYSSSPSNGRKASGISPRCSMVRYEMHLRASSCRGPSKASVGQASRHRVQFPHRSASNGALGCNSSATNSDPMKKNDPRWGLMRFVFFPNHPSPARRARSRSRMGAVST